MIISSQMRVRQRGFAWRRLLKWTGIAVVALLLVITLFAWWLLGSESGARFALARAVGATAGKLSVERTSGHLGGPLVLDGVRWNDPASGVDAKVTHLRVDLKPLALLAKQVRITALDVSGIDVALTTLPPKPEPPSAPFSLQAPIDIALDQLAVRDAKIAQDGKPVFALDSLDASAAWTRLGAVVKSLALRAPDGQVDLHGTVGSASGYPGDGETTFRWKVGDVEYAGNLKARGDGKRATLALELDTPTKATIDATLTQTSALPWTAKIAVPRFDPKLVQKDSTLASLALALEGSGDKNAGAINGDVAVNDHHVQIDPLRYALDGQTLKFETLTLKSPEAAGSLTASGAVQLDAKPISANALVEWQGVEIPADLAGQLLATHGKLNAAGSAEKFHADGALSIGPPGQLADLALDVDGTQELISIKQLALKQAQGGLDAHGEVKLKPALGWDIAAKASKLDPGAFAKAWPGALDFDLATQGTQTDDGPDATIKLDKLGGTLRKKPVSGQADLRVKPGHVVDGTLNLASGKSRVDVTGAGGENTDATIKLAIASLGDWLPDSGGRLDGQFRVHGKWPALAVDGRAHGAQIASGTTHLDTLDVDAAIASIDPPQGKFTLKATQLVSGSLAFDSLDVNGGGNQGAHELDLAATGKPLALKLALSGSAKDNGDWNGTLRTLDVDIDKAPPLALQRPATLAWQQRTFTASELCLAGGGTTLCASANGSADGSVDARYRIEQLPLSLLAQLGAADETFKVEGVINGHGDIRRAANGALNGTANIGSEKGSIAYADHADSPLLAYTGFNIDATLSPQATHATVRAALDHDGKLDGDVTLSGAPGSAQALSGNVNLALNSLAFVELVTPEVANAKGRIAANYTIGGTTSAPQLIGALTLKEFGAELPSAGLKLHDGDIAVRATDADHFVLEGTLKSGDGTLTLAGTGGIAPNAPLKATIKGDNFLAADIPAAKVVISPDLTIERSDKNLTVGGSVTIPKTDVDLAKLPGGGIASTSPDVVVVDAEQPAPGKPLPVIVSVDIKLGREVKLAGMGLDGQVKGQLHIDQRPGRQPVGTGTLNAEGTYRAYGQDLTIETGRLLFAGTALDNPGLDIRAVRKILGASGGQLDDTITAGLQVRGTALVPVLTVFSTPAMEQSEALSYLLTGKPLSGLKSGEGDMLGTAARALGSATGDLLAKGIGARMGVDAGVSDNAALGGAAFTVGKYLSPKLYLSYGVGLFTPGEVVSLKYLFNRRWNFEAQNATTGNRAGLNYRWEH